METAYHGRKRPAACCYFPRFSAASRAARRRLSPAREPGRGDGDEAVISQDLARGLVAWTHPGFSSRWARSNGRPVSPTTSPTLSDTAPTSAPTTPVAYAGSARARRSRATPTPGRAARRSEAGRITEAFVDRHSPDSPRARENAPEPPGKLPGPAGVRPRRRTRHAARQFAGRETSIAP